MSSDAPAENALLPPVAHAPGSPPLPPTPLWWRLAIAAGVVGLTVFAFVTQEQIGGRGTAVVGIVCFIGLVAALSANLRAVNWRTIVLGLVIQVSLALFILRLEVFGTRPGHELFNAIAVGVTKFLSFTDEGARFVFGPLADPVEMEKQFGRGRVFIFAFSALPKIIFVSSFFSVLYYLGVLQLIVRVMARVMMVLMGTSGAESLSASANVFMGQTEAPLIVRPYIARMTESELLALMVGGMATVSGGIMAVYVEFGADVVALLATSVMAAPCGLYLSKLMLPETDTPLTSGRVRVEVEQPYRNVMDAASGGASEGMKLAINVAAMLIAFLAFVALIDFLLGLVHEDLSLQRVFSVLFWPLAMLMGVEGPDIPKVADLLGFKLAANEVVAFSKLPGSGLIHERSKELATFALTSFANFASVGILLGGVGAMAPERRADLARLGARALFVAFTVTLINAALIGALK